MKVMLIPLAMAAMFFSTGISIFSIPKELRTRRGGPAQPNGRAWSAQVGALFCKCERGKESAECTSWTVYELLLHAANRVGPWVYLLSVPTFSIRRTLPEISAFARPPMCGI